MARRLSIFIGLMLLLWGNLYAQHYTMSREQEADRLYREKKYYRAEEIYRHLLAQDKNNRLLTVKYANSLYAINHYKQAARYYTQALEGTDTLQDITLLYRLCMAEKNSGLYEQAYRHMQRYAYWYKQGGTAFDSLPKAKPELQSLQYALEHKNDSIKYFVEHLPPPINTVNSEFNPVPLPGEKLVYSSYSSLFSQDYNTVFSRSYTAKIYMTEFKNYRWQKPREFSPKINTNKGFTANISFDAKYRTAYFTRCRNVNGSPEQCRIYRAINKNGRWKKAAPLPDAINAQGANTTQPFIYNGKDYDVLYFSSNRAGGYGGMDIWYAIIKNGKPGPAVNAGSIINTAGDEICPVYDGEKLYFSSNSHEGFGGFDIFESRGGLSGWEQPKNMGLPINSMNNDLFFFPLKNKEGAYLSSNRKGSLHKAGADYCCNDLYFVSTEVEKLHRQSPDSSSKAPDSTKIASIQKLLPITLYFDNDIPDPGSLSDTTTSRYDDLLAAYMLQRNTYRKAYSEGLKGKARQAAKDSIDHFFDHYVASGFDKLQAFTQLLKQELDEGKRVEITIYGYASPLNTGSYNDHLSKRRIISLYNYLMTSKQGYFKPYLSGPRENRKIILHQNPRGDRQAAPYVSNNPHDKKNSVYSKAAALERRIQIVMYASQSAEKP